MRIRALNTTCLVLALLSFSFLSIQANAQPDGKKLFKQNCASCHKPDKVLTGPALQGWADRVPDNPWIYDWVRNSQKMIQDGDVYGNQIYKEYNNTEMTAFPQLTDEEIDAIMLYVDNWTPPVDEQGPVTGDAEAEAGASPTLLLFILLALIVLSLILTRIVNALDRVVKEKMGEPVPEPLPMHKQILNAKVKVAAVIVLIVLAGYKTFDFTSKLGRQEGYAPEQPIAFSHKIHAGINKIDCQYCHSGAWKSRNAVIPSPNVCMNCHRAIPEGPNTGTSEISKIYAAVGWNPETQKYDGEQKPIEWIKIHNLPDHVYFSHAQHVNAGGLECQECHGPIEEMDVVRQHSPLSMGWCVNCHRDTDVQFDNAYYSTYEKLHEQLKNKEIKSVTAESIGATECQRCHY